VSILNGRILISDLGQFNLFMFFYHFDRKDVMLVMDYDNGMVVMNIGCRWWWRWDDEVFFFNI